MGFISIKQDGVFALRVAVGYLWDQHDLPLALSLL